MPETTLIKKAILKLSPKAALTCIAAFDIANALNISAADVGNTADLLDIKIVKCQLGLFGYKHKKKILRPKPMNSDLKQAILNAVRNDKITCKNTWIIAQQFNVHKLRVLSFCESEKIKIIECQLGAF